MDQAQNPHHLGVTGTAGALATSHGQISEQYRSNQRNIAISLSPFDYKLAYWVFVIVEYLLNRAEPTVSSLASLGDSYTVFRGDPNSRLHHKAHNTSYTLMTFVVLNTPAERPVL